jgi:hypothetical protein
MHEIKMNWKDLTSKIVLPLSNIFAEASFYERQIIAGVTNKNEQVDFKGLR